MEYFEKVISGFRPLIVFAKCSISDVRQSSEYPSGSIYEKIPESTEINNSIGTRWIKTNL